MFKMPTGVAALVVACLECLACTDGSSLKPGGGSGNGGQDGSSTSSIGGQTAHGSGGSGTGGQSDCICDAIGTGGTTVTGGTINVGADTVTVSTWVTDLVAAYCTWAIRCGEFPDAAACKAYMGPQFAAVNFNQASAAVTAVSDGKAQFDPTQAASCLTALSNLDCDVDFLSLSSIPEPCAVAFSGSVSDGGACIDDVECANGSMCVIDWTTTCDGTCMPTSEWACRTNDDCPSQQYCAAVVMQGPGLWGSGVCEAIVPPGATAGDPCGMPVQCAPGLSCVGGAAPARCAAAAGTGATCGGFSGSCAPGLACVTSDDGTTATCMPPAKLGDACTSLFQCGAQYKLSDIICDETVTHTCVHRPSTGPCSVVNRMNTCDPVTSYCDATAGTCRPWLSQGAACVFPSSGIDPCGIWNSCSGPVCAPLLGACTPK
jgi:hypothetical protein